MQNETDSIEYGIYCIINIYQNQTSRATDIERYYTQVNIKGKPVKFEIDSSSGYTFLLRDQFARLKFDVPLRPATIGFRSYT